MVEYVAYKELKMENTKTDALAHETHEIEQETEFTAAYRWQHWIRAVSILVLIITGFYIAVPFITPEPNPEPTNFLQAIIRTVHLVFGFVMIAVVLFKSYLFLFGGRTYRKEIGSLIDVINPKIWIQQIGYYLFLTKHPHIKGVYNPLQFVAYIGLYTLFFILIITGLILYVHVYHEGFAGLIYEPMLKLEVMLGGLAWVRELHHIAMWGVIIVVTVHIYMAIFNAVFGKEGSMDAIFSGLKWHKKH